jgi:hypothetical protein
MSGRIDPPQEDFHIPEFHRNVKLDGEGVSQVYVESFVHYQLPFLLRVKSEMDAGRILSDGELELMTRAIAQAHDINAFVFLHPELKTLVGRVIDLLHDITAEALRNAGEKPG